MADATPTASQVKPGDKLQLPPPVVPDRRPKKPGKKAIVRADSFRVEHDMVGPYPRGSRLTIDQLEALGAGPRDLERLVGLGAIGPCVEEDETDEADEADQE